VHLVYPAAETAHAGGACKLMDSLHDCLAPTNELSLPILGLLVQRRHACLLQRAMHACLLAAGCSCMPAAGRADVSSYEILLPPAMPSIRPAARSSHSATWRTRALRASCSPAAGGFCSHPCALRGIC